MSVYTNYITLNSNTACAAGTAYLSVQTAATSCMTMGNASCIAGITSGCEQKSSTDYAAYAFGNTATYMGIILYDSRRVANRS